MEIRSCLRAVIGLMGRIAVRGAGLWIAGPGVRIRISAGGSVRRDYERIP